MSLMRLEKKPDPAQKLPTKRDVFHAQRLPDIQVRTPDFGSLAPYQNVTFVIPWLDNGNPLRGRNLRYLLGLLDRLGAKHVILAVQGEMDPALIPDSNLNGALRIHRLKSRDRIFESPDAALEFVPPSEPGTPKPDLPETPLIRKSALINQTIPLSREWLFQLDVDLIYDFQEVLRRSKKGALNLPFQFFQMLTSPQTERLVRSHSVSVKQNPRVQNRAPAAGGFLMQSALMRGRFTFDENLRGWGGEDLDFFRRVRSRYPVQRHALHGVHLDHGNDRIHPTNVTTV